MGFRSFTVGVTVRILLIVFFVYLGLYIYHQDGSLIQATMFSVIVLFLTLNLISYSTTTNRKITRFLESIRYSDFSSSFTKDSKLGSSFREMNMSFNEVIEAFKKTRAEKEEQMLFLQIMIQHINTGIISFDSTGRIGVINGATSMAPMTTAALSLASPKPAIVADSTMSTRNCCR